jgi:hypothetical protein
VLSAVNAAIDGIVFFDAMPNDSTAAMLANWRECVNCAFEAVERVRASIHHHVERLVVFVTAGFASGHLTPQTIHNYPGQKKSRRLCALEANCKSDRGNTRDA